MKKTDIIEGAMRYRQIIILITTILVLFGCYALYKMPKQEFPTFTIRQGLVVGVYPGATSAQVEEQLTKPLENFIFSYKEVKKKKTFSQSRDGIVFINVELNDDVTNKDEFWSKFKHGLASFKNQLPSGVLALQANDDFGDTSALQNLQGTGKLFGQIGKPNPQNRICRKSSPIWFTKRTNKRLLGSKKIISLWYRK